MLDAPDAPALLGAVAAFLRAEAIPMLSGASAYQARVAANMLDIAARELALAPAARAEELASLRALLGAAARGTERAEAIADPQPNANKAPQPNPSAAPQAAPAGPGAEARADELAALNRALCEAIADGRAGPDTPGLAEHLWRTTLAKLAIDQPRYHTYRRVAGSSAADG